MIELVEAIAGRPWAIRAEIAIHVRNVVAREGIAGLRALAQLKADAHNFDARAARRGASSTPRKGRAVAVIPVIGTLTQRVQPIGSLSVTRSMEDVVAEVEEAAADDAIGAITLEVDSPGGEVFGVPEAWQAIREARNLKPVVTSVNSEASSAAYYLASAADEIWLTPSGIVGSVGVYMLHVDASKAIKKMGEAWEFVVAKDSPFKLEGSPTGPLSKEDREAFQAHVDRYMAMFVRDLARGRGVSRNVVRERFGRGRVLGADAARQAGMVDRIGTLRRAIQRAHQLAAQEQLDPGRQLRALRQSDEDRTLAERSPRELAQSEEQERAAELARRLLEIS
jgi:signal peptide peptidase SppA